MRIHPFCFLLVVVVPTLVTATTNNCIIGCQCKEINERKVKIQECDSPLNLTKDALSGISKKLTDIYLKNVVILRIYQDTFSEFKQLEKVIIEDANIESIDSNAFDLPELGTITFTKTTFGEDPQIKAQYVQEVIFKECKLSRVPNLDDLPPLCFLNLESNLIKEIDESTFFKVKSLNEVNLANNSISKLPRNLFKNNKDFNVLNLDYNPLGTFDLDLTSQEVSKLTGKSVKVYSLEYLSLNHCNLTSFNRSVTESLSLLSSLYITHNQLSVLEIDVFAPMKNLQYLDLSNNKLVELDDDIFYENSELDTITLDNNLFEALPKFKTNGKIFQTSTFSCKNCGLTSVAGSFDNMNNLVTLDLSNNKLTSIDGVFTTMSLLKKLSLSNNKIATIGINSFGKMSQLENLDLSNNPLLPLDPVVFTSLPQMKKLNVAGANLTQLWTNYNAELPSLEELIVSNNQLFLISVRDVKIMPNLKSLDLKGNPLVCEENLDFGDYILRNNIYSGSISAQTHEDLKSHAETELTARTSWSDIFPCFMNDLEIDEADLDDDTYDDDDDENLDDEIDYETNNEDAGVEASVLNISGFNLAKASYILSVILVFILTALLVLIVAVLTTLLILKRNKSFNMHNGNLPRLKIPLWHTTPGQKKHSGSVYRPLSEELSGSRTPIINRYDFKQTPQVHNSLS